MTAKPSSPGATETGVRGWLANLLELLEVRLELFGVEARLESQRLILGGVYGIVGALFVAFGAVFLAMLITVALWDSHPLLALSLFTLGFLGAGITLASLARRELRALGQMFGATREELQRDQQRLRGESPHDTP
jgi:uncharacterized membrane protein YqjE